MASNILQEFLVSLGYKVDGSSERHFTDSLRRATLQAKLLADALEAVARKTVEAVSEMAHGMEDLYYASQRTKESAANIKAFTFAAGQMGSTVEEAQNSIENFARTLRNNPGYEVLLRKLGIGPGGAAERIMQLGKKLATMAPHIASQYAQELGIDERTMFAIEKFAEFQERFDASKRKMGAVGIDYDSDVKGAARLMNQLRDLYNTLDMIFQSAAAKLFKEMGAQFTDFNDFLIKNAPALRDLLVEIGKAILAIVRALTAWAADPEVRDAIKNFAEDVKGAKINEVIESWLKPIKDLVYYLKWIGSWFDGEQNGATKFHDWMFGKEGGFAGSGKHPGDYGTPSGPEDTRNWWQRHAPKILGGQDAPGGNGSVGKWWTPERMKHAADRLQKEAGLTPQGASALVARWAGIEARGGPTAVNPISGAFGIGQWLGSRKTGINGNTDFDDQITHAVKELNGADAGAARAAEVLRRAKTPGEGSVGASMFERAEGFNQSTGRDNYTTKTPSQSVYDTIYGPKKDDTTGKATPEAEAKSRGALPMWLRSQAQAAEAQKNKSPYGDLSFKTSPLSNSWNRSSTSVSAPQTININGVPGADEAVTSFGRIGKRVNADLVRNLQNAAQ